MTDLKLGDVVTLGSQSYVVASVTGLPPYLWVLVLIPPGKAGADLGKTWTRAESPEAPLNLMRPNAPAVTVDLEPAAAPAVALPDAPQN